MNHETVLKKARLLKSIPNSLWTVKPAAGALHTNVFSLSLSLSTCSSSSSVPRRPLAHCYILLYYQSLLAPTKDFWWWTPGWAEPSTQLSARRVEYGLHKLRVIRVLLRGGGRAGRRRRRKKADAGVRQPSLGLVPGEEHLQAGGSSEDRRPLGGQPVSTDLQPCTHSSRGGLSSLADYKQG